MADEDVKPLSESRRLDEDLSWHVRTDELKQIRIDRVSDQLMFIGRAVSQAALTSEAQWQIQRRSIQDLTPDEEVKEFAVKGAYNQIWDDRAALFPPFTPGSDILGGVQIVTESGFRNLFSVSTLPINSVTWTAIPNTVGRKTLGIQNPNNTEVRVNSATPAGFAGWEIAKQGELFLDVSDLLTVNLRSAVGSPTVTIMELG